MSEIANGGGFRPRLLNECDYICNCPANDTAERVEREMREQIAKENETMQNAWRCPRTHSVGMGGCEYCNGFIDGLEVSANIARGK